MQLNDLYNLIQQRQKDMPIDSYTTSLFKEGEDRIIQKVGEEAVEVVIAAKNKEKNKTIYEIGDLVYHLLVLMVMKKITLEDIEKQLEKA